MRTYYAVNEIFYSLQGEGSRAGTANVFLRLSGCNLTCSGEEAEGQFLPVCDTEFVSSIRMTASEILDGCDEVVTCTPGNRWVICTGGEPLLQLDEALISTLHTGGYKIAVETNGTRECPLGVDWVSCSPKIAEHAMKLTHAHELRYVRHYGMGIPKPSIKSGELFISPTFQSDGTLNPRDLAWCIELVKQNPEWKLSVQQHKTWNIR